jgi:hypothetical protein
MFSALSAFLITPDHMASALDNSLCLRWLGSISCARLASEHRQLLLYPREGPVSFRSNSGLRIATDTLRWGSRSVIRCVALCLLDSIELCKRIAEVRIGRKGCLTQVKSSGKGRRPSCARRVPSPTTSSAFAALHLYQTGLLRIPPVEGR